MAKASATTLPTVEQWEYCIECYDGEEGKSSQHLFKSVETAVVMNRFGDQGWELVHITENTNHIKFYFKRRKQ